MIFYDYEKIWLLARGNSTLILYYFNIIVNKGTDYVLLLGDNFIVNPSIITRNPLRLTAKQLAEYLGLCALRPYMPFKEFKTTSLPLELFPNYVPKDIVEKSKLVKLVGTNIVFTKENQ